MRVFIVDDSKVEVERPADLLKEVPGTKLVGQAHDVPQAVHSIQKMKPDALILDLMPGGSGLDLLGKNSSLRGMGWWAANREPQSRRKDSGIRDSFRT